MLVRAQTEQKDLEFTRTFLSDEVTKLSGDLATATSAVTVLKDKAEALQASSAALTAQLHAGSGWTPEQKARAAELEEQRGELRAQLEGKHTTLNVLRRDVDALQEHVDRGDAAMVEVQTEISGVQGDIQGVSAKVQRQMKSKEVADEELKALQARIDEAHAALADKQSQVRDADELVAKHEAALKAKRLEVERFLQNYNALHKRTAQLTEELDAQMATNESLERELKDIADKVAAARRESSEFSAETDKYMRLQEAAVAKVRATEESKSKVRAAAACCSVASHCCCLSSASRGLRGEGELGGHGVVATRALAHSRTHHRRMCAHGHTRAGTRTHPVTPFLLPPTTRTRTPAHHSWSPRRRRCCACRWTRRQRVSRCPRRRRGTRLRRLRRPTRCCSTRWTT